MKRRRIESSLFTKRKKNSFLIALLSIVLILSPFSFLGDYVYIEAADSEVDFVYEVNSDNTVSIIRYTGNDTLVEIPETINHEGNVLDVVEIKGHAFFDQREFVKEVSLPKTIKSIDILAFDQVKLEKITVDLDNPYFKDSNGEGLYTKDGETLVRGTTSGKIEEGTKVVGNSAFRDAGLTGAINIPNSVETIGDAAFWNNEIESVTLPENNHFTIIPSTAFDGNKLTTIDIPDSVTEIKDRAFNNNELTEVTLPNGVLEIGTWAFRLNQLTEISLPESLVKIGEQAFASNQLTKIVIPENVREINNSFIFNNQVSEVIFYSETTTFDESAFSGLTYDHIIFGYEGSDIEQFANRKGLNFNIINEYMFVYAYRELPDGNLEITNYLDSSPTPEIPEKIVGKTVTAIGEGAFFDKQITSVTIPDTVTNIEFSAFYFNKLTEIKLPESLKEIGDFAFAENNLTSVELPSQLEVYGYAPFGGNNLEAISIAENSHFMHIEGKALYTKDGKTLIQGTNSGIIAEGTEMIGKGAFSGVGINGDIHIPNSVVKIEEFAFSGWIDLPWSTEQILRSVEIPESVEEIGIGAFADVQMEEVFFHEGLKIIDIGAFWMNNLRSVDLPKGIESIGNSAFAENDINQAIIRSNNVNILGDIFEENQLNNEDLKVWGYVGSDAEKLATDFGYAFKKFSQIKVNSNEPYNFDSEEMIEIVNSDEEVLAILHIPDFDTVEGLENARLLVYTVDEADIVAPGLTVAGEVLDFVFVSSNYDPDNPDPSEVLHVEGDFELSLRIFDEATGNVAIYHESSPDDWEHIGGTVDSHYITATVNSFSKYGVFNKMPIVESVETLADIEVEFGTELEDVTLPEKVEVTLDDGSKSLLEVVWDSGTPIYDGNQSGSYSFTGLLILPEGIENPNNVSATVTVIVGVQPTEPEDPTDPTDPENPSDPTEPEDPVDPSDPEKPEEPTDPTNPEEPTDPTEPEDPADPEEGTEEEEKETPKEEEKKDEEGEKLPKTATNIFNMLLIGFLLSFVGIGVLYFLSRRARLSN